MSTPCAACPGVMPRRASVMAQQYGHNLAADKAADRRPGEAHHDHRRPQAPRCVVAGQRRRPRKRAGNAEPGKEPQCAQHTESAGECAEQRSETENRDAAEQQRLASKAIADRPRRERARHDADWPVIFALGGLFPLALLLVMALWLPESPRFLASRANPAPRHRALLARLGITPGQAAHGVDIARENPVKMLFGKGYALQTVLLWVVFFCSLLNLYLFVFWLPEVLHLTGMTPSEAVFATSLHALGGIAAVLYLGFLIDRVGPERSLALHYAAGAVFVALIALVAMPYGILLAVIFFSGVTSIGSQTGANATCGALYPARMRTSGIGWALGIGRLGGIAAAPLGGFLLARGLPPREIFLSACFFALVAAMTTALLILRGTRGSTRNEPITAA